MGRAKDKEMPRNKFRNKYLGKGKTRTDSSFSTVLHQFYCHVAH